MNLSPRTPVVVSLATGFITALLVFICPQNTSARTDSSLTATLAQAAQHCRAERWQEALQTYQSALQLAPHSSEITNNLGYCYGKLGRYETAIAHHRKALGLDPNNASAHYNLGWSLNRLGHHREALAAYYQALALNPQDTAAMGNLGWSYLELKDFEQARYVYSQLAERCPDNASTQKGLGKAFEGLGRTNEAITAYNQAVRLDSDITEAHKRLATIFFARKQELKVFPHCAALLKLDNRCGRQFLDRLVAAIVERPVVAAYTPIYERYVSEYVKESANEFTTDVNRMESAFVAVQRLAELPLYKRDWGAAASVFERHRSQFPALDVRFRKILALLAVPEHGIIAERMESVINTDATETAPSLSLDEETLYFNRVERLADSALLLATRLITEHKKVSLLQRTKHGVYSIAADERSAVKVSGQKAVSVNNENIELARMVGNALVASQSLVFKNIRHVQDARLNVDGTVLLFAAERAESKKSHTAYHTLDTGNPSLDNTDLYVCIKRGSEWSEPISLGSRINTAFAEHTPFLHPDGKTLYFSSEGHYGLGRADVFMAKRLNDSSWTEWSEPVNCGKELNSPAANLDFIVATTGSYGYFSHRGDIFTTNIPPEVRPEPLALVFGSVLLEKSGIQYFHNGELRWIDASTGATVSTVRTTNGKYAVALPVGSEYLCVVDGEELDKIFDMRHEYTSVKLKRDIIRHYFKTPDAVPGVRK